MEKHLNGTIHLLVLIFPVSIILIYLYIGTIGLISDGGIIGITAALKSNTSLREINLGCMCCYLVSQTIQIIFKVQEEYQ